MATPPAATPPASDPAAAPIVGTRPAGIPEDRWDPTANTLKLTPEEYAAERKERDDLAAFKAADDSRRLTLAQKPEDVKIELPADFAMPEGATFEINPNDARAPLLQAWAVKYGVPQSAVSELIGIDASTQIKSEGEMTAFAADQVKQLGVNGTARADAATTWLSAMAGDAAKSLVASLNKYPVADTIRLVEVLIQKFSSQGGAQFSQQHRAAPDTKPTNEEFDSWSFADQREYHKTGKRPQRVAA